MWPSTLALVWHAGPCVDGPGWRAAAAFWEPHQVRQAFSANNSATALSLFDGALISSWTVFNRWGHAAGRPSELIAASWQCLKMTACGGRLGVMGCHRASMKLWWPAFLHFHPHTLATSPVHRSDRASSTLWERFCTSTRCPSVAASWSSES